MISKRDRETMLRLLRRLGRDALQQFIDELLKVDHRGRSRASFGAPRQSLAVALYALWSCRDVKSLDGGFAKTIGRIVEVQYARRGAAYELCFATEGAFRKDLERGLGNPDHEQIANILHGLVWWRCLHQYPAEFDPTWPSMISSACRNIIMTVKEPAVLFGWIDAARVRSRAGQ